MKERVQEVFSGALEKKTPAEREQYLAEACAGDAPLRQEVESLLAAHKQAGDYLQLPVAAGVVPETLLIPPLADAAGTLIGRYKLLQQIGEGGCGIVYMAEQQEPVRRQVALKVIKLGMDTKNVIARFEVERQALALMDHPNIAKVLDGGATTTGRPYFVMELVRGIKITDYCDKNNLPTRERLLLFVQVCQAVQHAHQKGIIHRDIKPSNILVTLRDGVPVPKVIDFGIAKATTDQRLTDKTLFTAFEQFIGTPAYMSPEQAEMSELGIDTRSDIYSLGVLLYELLTGQTPFDSQALLQEGLDEIRRIIREAEPDRPSTRLSTMDNADLTVVAKHRQMEPTKLSGLIRGELDWIVMKALEKDRGRRYETANGLAEDIQRHLDNEPVAARPPSNLYRLQKLVRRNKLVFGAIAAVITALVAGLVVSTWQFREKSRAEREQKSLRLQAEADKEEAQTEAVKSQQVAQFLKDMLKGVGPRVALGRDTTLLRDILQQTARRLDIDLTNQPAVEADLCQTLGGVYTDIGDYTNAAAMQRKALEIRKRLHPGNALDVAASLDYLGQACGSLPGRMAEAEALARQALDMRRKLLGPDHPDVAQSLSDLGLLLQASKPAEAEALDRQALAIRRKKYAEDPVPVADALDRLAILLAANGEGAEAEAAAREGLEIYKRAHSPDLANMLDALGLALSSQGKTTEAEMAFQEALDLRKKILGEEHPELDYSYANLGRLLSTEGKLPEAEAMYRKAWRRQMLSDAPTQMAWPTWPALVSVLRSEGKLAEVEEVYREVLIQQRKALDPVSPTLVETLCNLADCQAAQNKPDEAAESYHEAWDVFSKLNPQDVVRIKWVVPKLADSLGAQGQAADAEKFYEMIIAVERKILGEADPTLGKAYHDYAEFLNHRGNWTKAADEYRNALSIRRSRENDDLAWTLRDLGGVLLQAGRPREAEPYLRESLDLYYKLHNAEDLGATVWPTEMLGNALYQQGHLAEAEQAYRKALSIHSKCPTRDQSMYSSTLQSLISVLRVEKKLPEIESLYYETLTQASNAPTTDMAARLQIVQSLLTVIAAEKKASASAGLFAEWWQKAQAQLPANDPRSADILAQFTGALLAEQDFAQAEQFARRCFAIRERMPPNDWRTFDAESVLGGCLLGEKKYADAEAFLLPAYENLKLHRNNIPALEIARAKVALQRLMELFESTGRPAQAAALKTESTEWDRKELEELQKAADGGNAVALNELAWFLATCGNAEVRDGTNAVALAEKAVNATDRKDANYIDTLAAAYAEAGQFAKAVNAEKESIDLLQSDQMKEDFSSRLRLYESNTPYRQK